MAGIGTDEQGIIDVLCYRVASQRAEITATYSQIFGRVTFNLTPSSSAAEQRMTCIKCVPPLQDLVIDLTGELSGPFKDLTVSLTYPMNRFLAIDLHDSLGQTLGDDASVTEVLLSRTNAELESIKNDYTNSKQSHSDHINHSLAILNS